MKCKKKFIQSKIISSIDEMIAFLVVGLSFVASALSSFIEWLLIYRTDEYQNIQDKIEKTKKKLNIAKEKGQQKQITMHEEQIKELNQSLAASRLKSVFAIGITMFGFFGFLSQL